MKELELVRHLVHHPEGKRKVNGFTDPNRLLFAEMGDDTSFYARFFRPFSKGSQHRGLDVGSDHLASVSHHSCKRDGEITHPRSHIQDRVSLMNIGGKDIFRIVKELPDEIVEGKAQPPGAHVPFTNEKAVEGIFHESSFTSPHLAEKLQTKTLFCVSLWRILEESKDI